MSIIRPGGSSRWGDADPERLARLDLRIEI